MSVRQNGVLIAGSGSIDAYTKAETDALLNAKQDLLGGGTSGTLLTNSGTPGTVNASSIDATPTDGSNNPVSSDGVYDALAGKANTALSNITATGKEVIAHNAMPSTRYIDLTLGANGSNYTAPADGYFYVRKISNGAGQTLWIQNATARNLAGALTKSQSSGEYLSGYVPVAKNQVASVEYTVGGATQFFRFIYAIGAQ